MSQIKPSLLEVLKRKQSDIDLGLAEDDNAVKEWGRLQSIIKVIEAGGSEDEIKKACELAGESYE